MQSEEMGGSSSKKSVEQLSRLPWTAGEQVEQGKGGVHSVRGGVYVVHLSGLPWSATDEDIEQFLRGCKIEKILIVLNDHRKPSGDAKVWVSSKEDLDRALLCDRKYIGSRFVCVRKANDALENGTERSDDNCVKLSGLDWTSTNQEICDFLFGCEVLGGQSGVTIEMNERGKPSGSAIVHLITKTDVENALNYNKQKLGKRFVDIEKMATRS